MNNAELDTRIHDFLERKDAQFPAIGLISRDESRTIKFPLQRRMLHGTH